MPGDKTGHHARLLGIDHADHIDADPEARTGDDAVDAGPGRADSLQVRVTLERIGRRMPGERHADIHIKAGRTMINHLDAGRDPRKLGSEKFSKIGSGTDKNATHFCKRLLQGR